MLYVFKSEMLPFFNKKGTKEMDLYGVSCESKIFYEHCKHEGIFHALPSSLVIPASTAELGDLFFVLCSLYLYFEVYFITPFAVSC